MSNTTTPFTYILKFRPTNQYYYGVRWAKGCDPSDLWVTYFSSSSHIKKLIAEFGKDSFEFRISKTFQTKKQATSHERKFLLRVNAAQNGAFINKRNNMPEFSAAGLTVIHHPIYNFETWHDPKRPIPEGWVVGVTKSHKKANSACRLGRTPWNKNKILPPTGPCTSSRKQNISKSRLLTKKFTCIHCGKETDPGNFKRFHGDHCKHNPEIDQQYWDNLSKKSKESITKIIDSGNFNNFGRPKV
jgi:hypothetical protein